MFLQIEMTITFLDLSFVLEVAVKYFGFQPHVKITTDLINPYTRSKFLNKSR